MDSQALLFFHVAVSVLAIVTGLVLVAGLLSARLPAGLTAVFLVTSAATSLTGYLFHRSQVLPSHIVGAIALLVLAVTALALYRHQLRGGWRVVGVWGLVLSLYFNVFVLVAQAFLKVPSLHALAPHGSEPPFAIAQAVVLLLFAIAGVAAMRRFRPALRAGASLP